MITAVDTNVLLDVFGGDPTFGPSSKGMMDVCIAEGSLVACDAVWAELAAYFPSSRDASEQMDELGVAFHPLERAAALAAGNAWRAYRHRGGPRTRLVADFLVGAHALTQADRLLTRDARFHRTYFSRLKVLDPADP